MDKCPYIFLLCSKRLGFTNVNIWFLWYEDLVIWSWSWYLHWLQNAKTLKSLDGYHDQIQIIRSFKTQILTLVKPNLLEHHKRCRDIFPNFWHIFVQVPPTQFLIYKQCWDWLKDPTFYTLQSNFLCLMFS